MKDYLNLFTTIDHSKEWMIVGKGPSFDRIDEFKDKYNIFGLNHVAEIIKTDLTSIIDIDVLSLNIIANSKAIVMPWHPHFRNVASDFTLEDRLRNSFPPWESRGFLNEAELEGKLYWYNATTWREKHKVTLTDTIKVRFFSLEAAIEILVKLAVNKINLLGIDGGKDYSAKFNYLQPLGNGRLNFDRQFSELHKKIKKYSLRITNWGLGDLIKNDY